MVQLQGRHIRCRPLKSWRWARSSWPGIGGVSPPAIGSSSMVARLGLLTAIAQLYGGKTAISKGLARLYEGLYRCFTGRSCRPWRKLPDDRRTRLLSSGTASKSLVAGRANCRFFAQVLYSGLLEMPGRFADEA